MVNQSWNSIRLCLHENRALEHLDSESYCLTEPVRYQSKCIVTTFNYLVGRDFQWIGSDKVSGQFECYAFECHP